MSYLIRAVRANQPSFKAVEFKPGFNVVIADKTKESTKKNSRNGIGKSTLIEIIHFCLGANRQRFKGISSSILDDWSFSLEMSIAGKIVTVTRSNKEPQNVIIEGDTNDWILQPKEKKGQKLLHVKEYTKVLGHLIFGIPIGEKKEKFNPTFRSLISYFIRRGKEGYLNPFDHYSKQPEWNRQVNNAFLLGLSWEHARNLQLLKEQDLLLNNIKKLQKKSSKDTSFLQELGFAGELETLSLGELETFKVQFETLLAERKENLDNFKVNPEYHELEHKVDLLTKEIHDITTSKIVDNNLLGLYTSSIKQESNPEFVQVARIYESAGIELPNLVTKRLEEVEAFHNKIVTNRRDFLNSEIKRIRNLIEVKEELIQEKIDERADIYKILKTDGALEEHTKLQELYFNSFNRLNEINRRIKQLRNFEKKKSDLLIERENLTQRARRDYQELKAQASRAISLFNKNSQALYKAPGTLVVNVNNKGFQFNVDIASEGSIGIDNMKIFCYDLMLAELWSQRSPTPNILVHDSIIFDGVDERQIALALELAARKSEACGFQYICTLNSDMIPESEFSSDFDFDSYVRLKLTDNSDDGKLLGIQF